MNSDTQSKTPEITGAQAQDGLDELKKKLRRLNWRNGLLNVLLIVVLLFSIYRRYDEGTVYAKPDLDATQQLIPIEAEATPTPAPSGPDHEGDFVLYSVGDAFTATTGSGMAACEVHNEPGSTHDIVMRWTISESELRAHGLSTGGVDGEWIVAQSGLFEPGYSINAMQLRPLPDGSYLPAGLYNLTVYAIGYDGQETSPSLFTLPDGGTGTLQPGQSCALTVTLNPDALTAALEGQGTVSNGGLSDSMGKLMIAIAAAR